MLNGFYLVGAIAVLAYLVDPELTNAILLTTSYKIQIYFLNYRMKFAAWRIYRTLRKDFKKSFGTDIGPFKWVDIWDRG